MNSAANEYCFSQPHWRVIAQGFSTESWFNEKKADGTGGILMPKVISLSTGKYYYRFASSTSSHESQLGGGWWLDFENFKKIEQFATKNQYSIQDAARLMLALPYEWTRVNRLVRAKLIEPMKAYAGEGKPVKMSSSKNQKGTIWVPTQHIKILQLYIPGLFIISPKPKNQLYETVFSDTTIKSIL